MIEILGQSYAVTIGNDIQHDGMYLEVEDGESAVLAEVFYSDRNDSMTFTGYRADLSLSLVERLIAPARERLTPTRRNGS
ncbi:hypothetical protein [Sphingomonas dokdonensis]|uniref:Uncharacterized protein n=1 Tax=Sphingomonas dokdonensis TaxID=344880 RepID=A0A245ZNJ8_9SPHN|nr:hypothetical protein [Sphingomonas dokdonensis]OWK31324.1 hypothetical protein SPDO_13320 [Sphingomonas dokdonensis]